jgi:hypothetical protein
MDGWLGGWMDGWMDGCNEQPRNPKHPSLVENKYKKPEGETKQIEETYILNPPAPRVYCMLICFPPPHPLD